MGGIKYYKQIFTCPEHLYVFRFSRGTHKTSMLYKWKTIGLDNDIDAVDVNLNHQHLKVMAKALAKKKGKMLETLISKLANETTWDKTLGAKRWMDVSYSYVVPK
jgi:hypothetical protein